MIRKFTISFFKNYFRSRFDESGNHCTSSSTDPSTVRSEREKLLRGRSLHWFHWVVVTLSVILTLGVWWFSRSQIQEKIRSQFDRETNQIIDLISERMQKYEDGLWGGVGAIAVRNGYISYREWKAFAETLSIDVKYPGINGIGVIFWVPPAKLELFLAQQRQDRPQFNLHPSHQESEFLPITYIEPSDSNFEAIGLDMAHEENRYRAAKMARDTGQAQITAPIVLVQDAEKTPGFLFYAPFYSRSSKHATIHQRQQSFVGMVYAPFVVNKLMEGTLHKHKRRIGMRISDGLPLYDELIDSEPDFDSKPLFRRNQTLDLYGRTWKFEFQSGKSFRAIADGGEPTAILIGGLFIDGLLLTLFILMSRSNRHTLRYADMVTIDLDRAYQNEQKAREILESAQRTLKQQTEQLKTSNRELQNFASIAAHDLQEPLRKIQSFGERIEQRYGPELPQQALHYFQRMCSSAKRMSTLIHDILTFSRVTAQETEFQPIDLSLILNEVIEELSEKLEETGGSIRTRGLHIIKGNESQIRQLFRNLLWNSLKYRRKEEPPKILVTGQHLTTLNSEHSKATYCIEFSDNGIGFENKYSEKIFTIFQRLHGKSAYEGTGIGLALCRKIAEHHGGTITAYGRPNEGATFRLSFPCDLRKEVAA